MVIENSDKQNNYGLDEVLDTNLTSFYDTSSLMRQSYGGAKYPKFIKPIKWVDKDERGSLEKISISLVDSNRKSSEFFTKRR